VDNKQNILLITVDSLRADAVGHIGEASGDHTPNIDAVASNGETFLTAFANAPYTRASFPAIFSGSHPWAFGGYRTFTDKRPHLAKHLNSVGYATAGFHSNPYLDARFGYDRGFDRFHGGETSMSLSAKAHQIVSERLSEDSPLFRVLRYAKNTFESLTDSKIGLPYLPAEEINTLALDWAETAPEPVFLWVHYMDVHNPYLPHTDTVSSDVDTGTAVDLHNRLIQRPESLNENDHSVLRQLYHGEVEYVDEQINGLVNSFENRTDGDVLLAILSDHGEGFGEHGYYSHTVDELHDELLRIPLIFAGPNVRERTVEAPVTTVDIVPSLLEYAGEEATLPSAGESVASLGSEEDRTVFAQIGDVNQGKVMAADGRWKLIRSIAEARERLYDRRNDPEETTDVSSEHEQVLSRLQAELDSFLQSFNANAQIESDIGDDLRDQLAQLGYVED